ncbi:hypothetical protein ACIBI9_17895 [Nonomuraea sp. NPDC050451]|uniref:hypothetical protein n=1 Tax=Nonomuraea sp. NPDC050451 TaxID=3364364 RepID=UPI0037AEF821
MESWSADFTLFGRSSQYRTFVNPRRRSSSSLAALAPASCWCVSSKWVSSASMASRRTETPRRLIFGGWPERRGSASTSAGESGRNFTVSPSGSGPCRGRSAYRITKFPRKSV